MKKTFALLSFLFFLFSLNSPIQAQIKKKVTVKASANAKVEETEKKEKPIQETIPPVNPPKKNESELSKLNSEILDEINLFRTDPIAYVQFLEEFKDKFDGNYLQLSSTSKIPTVEGVAAVDEAINEISKIKPLKPFIFSAELSKAADDHIKDMIEKSFFSHRGSDGNTPDFRIAKYLKISQSEIRENLSSGNKNARAIVISWLVDDGSTRRGNRLSLVSQNLKFIGISTGINKEKMTLAVAAFSSDNRK